MPLSNGVSGTSQRSKVLTLSVFRLITPSHLLVGEILAQQFGILEVATEIYPFFHKPCNVCILHRLRLRAPVRKVDQYPAIASSQLHAIGTGLFDG
ncbi:hypothetical protein AYI70_g8815 [Smittium culicis]|uniref:Uncharacterized protein n=1 Tax=Smittium culicis TaxID=133412 RepID=A0A1R1XE70_9FUNG|nr:hypothetical protein AYI70_g8815 [Smittium culicis]